LKDISRALRIFLFIACISSVFMVGSKACC